MPPGWRNLFTPPEQPLAFGKHIEQAGAAYLRRQGLELVEQNYRCRRGEIDLVMRQRELLVFVEVRFRRSLTFGTGAESVTRAKQQKLVSTARHYIHSRRLGESRCYRFDVLAVTASRSTQSQLQFSWIQDAFQFNHHPGG